MFRWATRSSFFRCAHVRAGVLLERRRWLDTCVQSFVSPFASKASRHDAITRSPVMLSALKVSRNRRNANLSEYLEVRRLPAHDASGVAKISLHNAATQDVDFNFCTSDVKALACSHHDAKSHFVHGDAKVFAFAACMPQSNTQFTNGCARVTDSVASLNDDLILASSSKFNDKCLPGDVSNASCKTQSRHVSLQTLFEQTSKETPKVSADLQQKIELLESEQFSLSDARRILKAKAFKSCSVEQLAAALQELEKSFPCAKVMHNIVVRSSSVLLQPAELVQQKLKLLHDFQLEEKVVSKLCGKGGVLSLSMESLQQKLMFYDDIGLTVAARNTMFSKGPLILSLSIEKSIQPVLKFLEGTGLTKQSVLKLAQHCPEMFYMSLDNNLVKKYDYFRQLGVPLKLFPRAFFYGRRFSIKQMDERLQFLKVLGFTNDDVHLMLKKRPEIITLSSENMKCKVDFLICKQNRNLAEIVRFPRCLMSSLQARMIPRFNVVNELGHSTVYSLSCILSPTDSTFINQFRKAIDPKSGLCAQLETCCVKT